MTVIIANNTPNAVRGLLKRWFIEPRPNVFVGSVNRKVRTRIVDYVRRHAPKLGMLVIADASNVQGFAMQSLGDPKYRMKTITGLQLIEDYQLPAAATSLEQPGHHPQDADTGTRTIT